MVSETFKNVDSRKPMGSGFKSFRHFYLFCTASIIIILLVAGVGLRYVLRNLVIQKAEEDAIRVSTVARDGEIRRYIGQHDLANEQFLTIPPTELTELDRDMSVFFAPFDVVKIKIYNTEPRIIYSTDPVTIGRLDPHNAKLLTALSGKPISKHESKDHLWDFEDEERKNVEIVETYVPMYGTDGKIVGSFEIYKDITRNLAMANRIFLRSWGALAITVLSVFTVFMFVIYRSFQTIKASSVSLTITNDQLQQEIEDRKRLEKELLSLLHEPLRPVAGSR